MNAKIELNEIRDLSTRVSATFSFIKQNGKIIAKNLVYLIPVYILIGIIMGMYMSSFYTILGPAMAGNYTDFDIESVIGIYVVIFVISVAISLVSLIAMLFVTAYVVLYNRSEDGFVDTSEAWTKVKDCLLGSLGGGILAIIAITIGLFLCILPGIALMVLFSLFIPAYVAGKYQANPTSALGSLGESVSLVKKNFFGAFGFLFVIGIIVVVFSIAFSIPISIIQQLTILLHSTPVWMTVLYAITYSLSYVGSLFFSAIIYIAVVFLYYDYKERQDGTSIQQKIENIGQN